MALFSEKNWQLITVDSNRTQYIRLNRNILLSTIASWLHQPSDETPRVGQKQLRIEHIFGRKHAIVYSFYGMCTTSCVLTNLRRRPWYGRRGATQPMSYLLCFSYHAAESEIVAMSMKNWLIIISNSGKRAVSLLFTRQPAECTEAVFLDCTLVHANSFSGLFYRTARKY